MDRSNAGVDKTDKEKSKSNRLSKEEITEKLIERSVKPKFSMTWVFTLKNDIRFSYSCKPKEWKGKRPKKWDLVKLDNQGVEKEYVVIDVILDNEPGMKFKRNFVLEIYDKDKHKRVTEHFQY